MKNLRTTAARGTAAMGLGMVVHRLIHIPVLVILARLLTPEDFGLFALGMIPINLSVPLLGLGVQIALVQSQEPKHKVAFHASVITMVVGLLVFAGMALGNGFLAALLDEPRIAPIVRVCAIVFLIESFALVSQSLLTKDLFFTRTSVLHLLADLTALAISVSMALMGFGYWSLVFGALGRSIVRWFASWLLYPDWYWMRPTRWDWGLTRRMLRFGAQTTSSGFLNFFTATFDSLFVGRILGTNPLGFYSKAYDIVKLTETIPELLARVLFPSFSKLQDSRERLSRAYVMAIRYVSVFTVPLGVGVFVIAPELVPTVFGEQWVPMIPTLQILALMTVWKPLSSISSPLFLSAGKPFYNIRTSLLVLGLLVPLCFALQVWGIAGIAAAVAFTHAAGFFFNLYQANLILPGTAQPVLRSLIPSVLASAVMYGAVSGARMVTMGAFDLSVGATSTIVLLIVGLLAYPTAVRLLFRSLFHEIIDLARTVVRRRGTPEAASAS